ncbi:MAG: LysR family transcriptional regulator [Clostridiales bacterium]|nr:LysR family transcriptional regulator [Clostridiales bacterium]MBQ3046690.1 LysR family transcriptional regulator [Clostridia bacterium]
MVNLELYRVFYTVAKCGSLTKAAEELYISQPAVSQAIKQLESQLGGKLFNRTHKGMELSETGGKQIFSTVEKALKLFDDAESKYAEFKDTATGVVRICASDTVATHFLLPFIKEYHEKYPDVNLILQNGTSSETIELLKNNKGDVGFVNLPIDDSDIHLSNTVMQLHDTFVASEKFSELFGEVVDLKRLQDYPLLMLELSTATRQAIVSFAHSQGVHLHPEIELASLELMTELAKNGIGIACIPKEFVAHELEDGTLKEIKTNPALPTRAVGLALPKHENLTFAVKEFIKLVNKV